MSRRLLEDGPIRRILRGQNASSEPTPSYTVLTWYLEKLQDALQDEKSAIDMYRSLINNASEIGYQDDVEHLTKILHDEEGHHSDLLELISDVEDQLRIRGWKL